MILPLIALGIFILVVLVGTFVVTLEGIACWLDDADFSDKEETPYLDNSEYDWGHNVKNYMDYE